MVDFWIGPLLAKLDVLGLGDNMVIFFVSNHGFYFGRAEWIDTWAPLTEGTVAPS